MLKHLARISALIILILVCMFLPFLPGNYDDLAVTLSFMAQLLAFAGVLLVPIGVLWLISELRAQASRRRGQPARGKRYYFAVAALVVGTLVIVIVSLAAFGNVGPSLGIALLALWAYCLWRIVPGLKALRYKENPSFNPAPLYLICIPLAALILRMTLVAPAIEFSRNYAIRHSAELIEDIEAYRDANGQYPVSLASLWKDYKPGIRGVEQFHYEPSGEAYNVFFEQFAYDLATREIVMYNKLDEQVITSHDSWILVLSPADLESARGYYAVNDASVPHWKYFWFD